MKPSLLVLLTLCFAGLACQSQPERPQPADEQAVVDTLAILAQRFSQAFVEGNTQAMTALYTDDAVLLPRNSEYIRGKDAIRQYWTLPPGRRITHHRIMPVEVEVSGAMASDFGHYEISGEDDGAPWGPVYGKYVVVWKRGDDGRWRMHLDIWNRRMQPEP